MFCAMVGARGARIEVCSCVACGHHQKLHCQSKHTGLVRRTAVCLRPAHQHYTTTMSVAGSRRVPATSREADLFPEYANNGDTRVFRTAIDDTTFSPEVKAKVADWHRRSHDLLSDLDAMLTRRRQVADPHLAEAERLCEEARAILLTIRLALAEALDGGDPLGAMVRHVKAQLPPLAPAAADAVCDLTDTEISAVRALNRSPPTMVRVVVCCCVSLLRLGQPGITPEAPAASARPFATWEEASAMLARPDFSKALKGFDPRTLHAHPATATSLRSKLADLGKSTGGGGTAGGGGGGSGSVTRRALGRAVRSSANAPPASATAAAVNQVVVLKAAVRSGGRAVGQLYLWCARVLAEAENLLREEQLEQAQEQESEALASALARAQEQLERTEQRVSTLSNEH